MDKKSVTYWDKKQISYSKREYIDKPSIFAEEVANYIPLSSYILELGSGNGQDSLYFASLGHRVLCTDLSKVGILNASKKAKDRYIVDRFAIKQVDMSMHLPFDKETFDIVYSHGALQYFDKKRTEELFQEIANILKPGGKLIAMLNSIMDPEITEHNYIKLDDYFYENEFGIRRRYYDVPSVKKFLCPYFSFELLDEKGRSYKDKIDSLVRVVAIKL